MKAKELKEACIKEGVIDINLLDDENLFSEFITKLCKEQRELCYDEILDEKDPYRAIVEAIKEIVLNAPAPEL